MSPGSHQHQWNLWVPWRDLGVVLASAHPLGHPHNPSPSQTIQCCCRSKYTSVPDQQRLPALFHSCPAAVFIFLGHQRFYSHRFALLNTQVYGTQMTLPGFLVVLFTYHKHDREGNATPTHRFHLQFLGFCLLLLCMCYFLRDLYIIHGFLFNADKQAQCLMPVKWALFHWDTIPAPFFQRSSKRMYNQF